jgi:hypothetical protein
MNSGLLAPAPNGRRVGDHRDDLVSAFPEEGRDTRHKQLIPEQQARESARRGNITVKHGYLPYNNRAETKRAHGAHERVSSGLFPLW